MSFDVVTIGDCINDRFIELHEVKTSRTKFGEVNLCFEHGEKISVDETYEDVGGSACNVAVSLSRLGFKSGIVSAVGGDGETDKIIDRLNSENVDIKFIKSFPKNKTNFSIIIVYKAERTVFVYRGLKDYSQIKIPKILRTKWIYLGPVANSFEPNYKDLICLASEKNINLTVNPGHRQIVDGRPALVKLLYVTNILILNKEEAIDLTKMNKLVSIKELLRRLKGLGPKIVIITDGVNGAYLTNGEEYIGIKSTELNAVDSTGSGDAFSSGFLASYIKNDDVKQAMKWGIMTSGEVVKDFGAQTKLPTFEKLTELEKDSPSIYNL